MQSGSPPSNNGGLAAALGAYFIWGLMPVYLHFVQQVPPIEFLGWRIVLTLPLCIAIVALLGQGAEVRAALVNPRALYWLAASALMIGMNWLIYLFAISRGHVFAASLGYYINPLLNVVIGTLFLGERLTSRRWLAAGLAAAGVMLLAWGAQETLLYSGAIAITFALYGLIRKLAPTGAVPGLTIESLLLLPIAIVLVWWSAQAPGGSSMGRDLPSSLLIALSAPMTAVPLVLFAIAARRMDYSALGFVQFLAPTMVFIEGLWLYGEPLRPVQLACFVLIWCAIAVFVWDLLAQRRASALAA